MEFSGSTKAVQGGYFCQGFEVTPQCDGVNQLYSTLCSEFTGSPGLKIIGLLSSVKGNTWLLGVEGSDCPWCPCDHSQDQAIETRQPFQGVSGGDTFVLEVTHTPED